MNDQSRVAITGRERSLRPMPFLDNIHSLRALAIVVIVGGHVCGELRMLDASPSLSILSTLIDDGSVIFVFVAGFLFEHLRRSYTYSSYLRKKIANVIVPYLLLSVPAVYIAIAWHGANPPYPELQGHSSLYQTAWYYLKGGAHLNGALWFIPMIGVYYLAAPAFMAVIHRPRLYLLILPLFCMSAVLKRPLFPNLDTMHLVIYMLPAYLMGMWCSQFGDSALWVFERRPWLTWGLCGAVWLLPIVVSTHSGNYTESGYFTFERGWIDWLFVQKALLAVLLTAAFKHVPNALH